MPLFLSGGKLKIHFRPFGKRLFRHRPLQPSAALLRHWKTA